MVRLIIFLAGLMLSLVLLVEAKSWQEAFWGIAFAIITASIFVYWRWRERQTESEAVSFDEREIIRKVPDGSVERINWQDVARISIITTDDGPWDEDAYWVFEDEQRQNGCMIGNGADGFPELLEHITKFEGFNEITVIEAMGCVSNKHFVVWNRPGKGS